jgi:hypothetical protein
MAGCNDNNLARKNIKLIIQFLNLGDKTSIDDTNHIDPDFTGNLINEDNYPDSPSVGISENEISIRSNRKTDGMDSTCLEFADLMDTLKSAQTDKSSSMPIRGISRGLEECLSNLDLSKSDLILGFLLYDIYGRKNDQWEGHIDFYQEKKGHANDEDYLFNDASLGLQDTDLTNEFDICVYTVTKNLNCRQSTSVNSIIIDILLAGEKANLIAVNQTQTHGKFLSDGGPCWIYLELMDGPVDPLADCRVGVEKPPLPIVISSKDKPDSDDIECSKDLSDSDCKDAGGTWVGGVASAPYCNCP